MGLIGLQFPDISVVFCDGSVGGEETGLGGVCKAFLQPADGIAGVVSHGLLLAHYISVTLRKEPSKKAEALADVPLGATVERLNTTEGEFTKVMYQEKEGYILTTYLSCKN